MEMIERLNRPKGIADVILDTDTYNEVDDQFALSYLMLSPDQVSVQAIYAAPFFDEGRVLGNYKSESAEDGMEKSYQEILKLLRLMGREDYFDHVFKGSKRFLKSDSDYVESDASNDLIERAMKYSPEHPLYVIAIGSPVNVASALRMRPEIRERIVVVFLGGHRLDWPNTREFNMAQDVWSSRELFKDDVALVQVPCMGVASALTVSPQELNVFLRGKNSLTTYLTEIVCKDMRDPDGKGLWSRVIWDVTAAAWFMGEDFLLDRIEQKPEISIDYRYGKRQDAGWMRYVYYVNRHLVLNDLFTKLTSL